METTVKKKDHYWIITFEGDLSGLMPGPIPEVIKALNEGAHEIILNFAKVRFLNPIGIKALRESMEIAGKRDANIGIASPQPQVRKTLKISGLVPDMPIYFSEREAIVKLDLVDYQDSAKLDSTDRLIICQNKLPIAGHLRDALRKHPLKLHYRMIPCRDMKDAMKTIMEERIDCIIIDSTFPLYQVTGFIEDVQTDERLPCIPILIVSSDDKLAEAELMIRNGAHDILRYPFQPVEAIVRLQTLISHLKDHRPFTPPEKIEQPRGWKAGR